MSIFSFQSLSNELSIGFIEEIYLKSGTNERRIQIYYPYSKNVNDQTKFIIMNDGEELFSESDSWNGKAWNIDETFKDLKTQKENLNLVIIAIDSAKRINGNILDETRRYAEYFPKESIKYIDENLKRSIYHNFIDSQKFNYQDFVINKVIPSIEKKFDTKLNRDNLGIIGASMGGLSALNMSIENPEIFGFVGCISTHWVGIKISEYLILPFRMKISGDESTTKAIQKYIKKNVSKLSSQKLYFDHGTVGLDSLYENPQNEINKILLGSKINFIYEVHPNHDHEPKFFGQRFKNILLNFIDN
jgi:predicted alpha/beta superfamily hydrolase|tara:strand:- start:120 stop:1028 length:909 start_codon:yes stop_codon:yes gene_type:complete